MDRAFACRAEGLGFDPYRAQVSAGRFLDCTHPSLLPLEGSEYGMPASFQEKRKTLLGPCLVRDTGIILYLFINFENYLRI